MNNQNSEQKEQENKKVVIQGPSSFRSFTNLFPQISLDILGVLGSLSYKTFMVPFMFLQKVLGKPIRGDKFQPEKGDKPLKIAIVGGGAAGLSAAWSFYNTEGFEFTVFERSKKCGGAADTFQFKTEYGDIPCDLGFVYAHRYCYENLLEIMKQVGAEPIDAELSISVNFDNNFFWAQTLENQGDENKKKYFLDKDAIKECERFQKLSEKYVSNPITTWIPIKTFLKIFGFSENFKTHILYPLLFCLFASVYKEIDQVPARIPFDLFANKNYKFLNFLNSAKQLFTIKHGNQEYTDRLQFLLKDHIRLNSPVTSIKRIEQNGQKKVLVQVEGNQNYEMFDHVLIACSAKATQLILEDKTHLENYALSKICQTMIPIYLHKDQSFRPPDEFLRPMMYKNTKGHPEFTLIPQMVQYNGIDEKLRKIDLKEDLLMVSMCPHKVPKNVIATKFCPIHLPTLDHIIVMSFVQPMIQGRGNVWFCNSWTSPGGQLGAIDAGVAAAVRLGAVSPLKPKLMKEQFEIQGLCMYGPCFDWQNNVRKSIKNDQKIKETLQNFRPRL